MQMKVPSYVIPEVHEPSSTRNGMFLPNATTYLINGMNNGLEDGMVYGMDYGMEHWEAKFTGFFNALLLLAL